MNYRHDLSLLSDYDIFLFKKGSHLRLYEKLGAHLLTTGEGEAGCCFAVWAPNARAVSVVGDFNAWRPGAHPMAARWDGSGIWEIFIPGLGPGALYKYHIVSSEGGYQVQKSDPFAFGCETPPRTASAVRGLEYAWEDGSWMEQRAAANALSAPMAVYELHAGSWRRAPGEGGRFLTYRELADQLAEHVLATGFTHVELLPVMEHPFYGSWGYQVTGYFAPTSRYGSPQDFMYLVDHLHQAGIGVILDWVPSHFPADEHGLGYFDGTHLYEHADPRKGFHPDWNSWIFNYGRHEVRSFLLSSALFWLDCYHADGLRVDAVSSMLYLDYGRRSGEWIPNEHGGRENLEAVSLLKELNEAIYREHPDVQSIAEESTSWPMVTRPTWGGGLGFGLKWKMGWMHDSLDYFARDPVHRRYHQDKLTFSMWYAFSENFLLPLSHDEVVHGKGSLLGKMPGDDWRRFANLRLLYGYQYTHPGKKLLFMGGEFGQWREWGHDRSLDWDLLDHAPHQGLQSWVADLNRLYRAEPALHTRDFDPEGFRWVDCSDVEESVISYLRCGPDPADTLLVVFNGTPVPRHNYRLGVPDAGFWQERLNSDSRIYGGSGQGNLGGLDTVPVAAHGFYQSLTLTLPPLGILVFKRGARP